MARPPLSPLTLGVVVREGCLLRAGELLLLSNALLDGAKDAMRWSQPVTIATRRARSVVAGAYGSTRA